MGCPPGPANTTRILNHLPRRQATTRPICEGLS
ncbi:rCG37012 [Rattus norvegicus]|uniref:RCG37012 n=1 Tax=Rattus norvegicus TaxID=10116 RepID=A6HU81_RAT|nr:rCG37012 [Rattus norvegicus]